MFRLEAQFHNQNHSPAHSHYFRQSFDPFATSKTFWLSLLTNSSWQWHFWLVFTSKRTTHDSTNSNINFSNFRQLKPQVFIVKGYIVKHSFTQIFKILSKILSNKITFRLITFHKVLMQYEFSRLIPFHFQWIVKQNDKKHIAS